MDLNIKEKTIISETEIDKTKGIVYDFGEDNPTGNLPNVSEILDDVIKILECINTEEMKILKETNKTLFENIIEEKFPAFAFKYYAVFKMLLSGEDITPLFKMFDIIAHINSDKMSLEDGEKHVGKYLTKFLPEGLIDKIENGELNINDIENAHNIKKNKY